jgi:LPPG:FO 2-phospho-L-lactate transferase
VTYTLAGASNDETGWGLAGESWTVMGSLQHFNYSSGPGGANLTWFNLGDRDLATHLFRTGRLAAGATLSQVTAEVAHRFGVTARLLPMTDSPVETRVTVELDEHVRPFGGLRARSGASEQIGPGGPGGLLTEEPLGTGLVEIGFQEFFVGLRHSVDVKNVRFDGIELAQPAPGVIEAIEAAEVVVICPSNPIVSIGPVLAVHGIADAVARRREDAVAVSPIIAGKALKGPADRMLANLGHEVSVVGVARLWAPLAATLVVDEADSELAAEVEAEGMRCVVAPAVMSGPTEAANLARTVLGASTRC